MSNLSGYDSEVVGFESVTQNKKKETNMSTQTSGYEQYGVGSQTNTSIDHSCSAYLDEEREDERQDVLKEYPPPGLNEFLKRVVPCMMEQLEQRDRELYSFASSDSDEEETVAAKLTQEIKVSHNMPGFGSGDQPNVILGVSWSSAGNSVAVSIGKPQHEHWCDHDGLIRVYTTRRSEGDKFVHLLDISEKNCVTTVKYHPSIAALLAYGTTSGEVVLCDLRNANSSSFGEEPQLTSPPGCHGSKRVSSLQWADAPLANTFLLLHIKNTGRRRGASDQVLISAGSDGTINVWQVNVNSKIFQNIICYNIDGARKSPDITCFDFVKRNPLRPCDEKVVDDIFAVGCKSGKLYICKLKEYKQLTNDTVDPVYEVLEGHSTCVLDLAFSTQRSGMFASISMDSELKLYDTNKCSPMRTIYLETPISCMCWLPNSPSLVVVGLVKGEADSLRLYNVASGRPVPVEGLGGGGSVTSLAVSPGGACRVAAGDADTMLRVYELPAGRIRLTAQELDF